MFNKNQTGLVLGTLFAIMHFLWVIVLGIGAGKWFLDSVHNVHFIAMEAGVGGLNFGVVILGLVFAFICGYIIGWVFGWLWGLFAKK